MDWRRIVGANIRLIREERNLSQEQLGFDAGIDFGYLGKIERGQRNPSLLKLAKIAEAMDVDLALFFVRK